MGYIGAAMMLALTLFSSACTRSVDGDLQLNIQIPSKLGTLAGHNLEMVLINLRTSPTAPPIIHQQKFALGFGETATVKVVVPGFKVPRAKSLIVQYLGMYEAPGLPSKLRYGSTTVDSDKEGPIEARFTAVNIGTITKEANIQGRYMPSGAGPTGVVRSYFKPPGSDPEMLIQKSEVFNGWLNLMVFEGVNFEHRVFDVTNGYVEKVIFGGPVNLASFTSATSLVGLEIPSARTVEYTEGGGAYLKPTPPKRWVLGFFQDGTGGPPISAGIPYGSNKACYKNNPHTIPNRYHVSFLNPQVFDATASAPAAYIAGGGVPTGCTLANDYSTEVHINSEWLAYSDQGPLGFLGPFRAYNKNGDYSGEPKFVQPSMRDNSGTPEVSLLWNYLPGVAAAGLVDGVEVFRMSGGYYGDYYRPDEAAVPCNEVALFEGYTKVGEVLHTDSPNNSFTDATTFNYTYGDTNHWSNHTYRLCPFRVEGAVRKYYSTYAESEPLCEGCSQDSFHYGLQPPLVFSFAVTSPVANRVTSVTPYTNLEYTELAMSSTAGFSVGSEIMLRIAGRNGSGSVCGLREGNSNEVFKTHFARVIGLTGSTLRILKGSWVDELNVVNANLSNAVGAAQTFCFLQAVTVPHYGSLSLSSWAGTTPFAYADTDLGILPMRVSGTMTMGTSAYLSVEGAGYNSFSGAESFGTEYFFGSAGTGAQGAFAYLGGAGGGNGTFGGNSGSALAGGAASWGEFGMGGAGAGADDSMVPLSGSAGGGTLFISARKIQNNYTSAGDILNAAGLSAINSHTGGGAGGTIILNAQKIVNNATNTTLSLGLHGGDGSAASPAGGGGGVGRAFIRVCDSTQVSVTAMPGIGGTGAQPGGSPLWDLSDIVSYSQQDFCP